MKILKAEELVPLHEALQELLKFLQKVQWKEVPYFYHFLDYMKHNIEIYFYTQSEDLELVSQVLYRDWRAANGMYTGIQFCDFQKNTPEEEIEAFETYQKMLSEVGKFF